MMKLTSQMVMLFTAMVLLLVAGRLAMLNRTQWESLKQFDQARDTASQALLAARTQQIQVFGHIPQATQHLQPLSRVAIDGAFGLYRLAIAHHLMVGTLSIQGAAPGKIVVEQAAHPVPGTSGHIQRVMFLFKVGFHEAGDLGDFIAQIPRTGGYFSAITGIAGNASLLVGFLGV